MDPLLLAAIRTEEHQSSPGIVIDDTTPGILRLRHARGWEATVRLEGECLVLRDGRAVLREPAIAGVRAIYFGVERWHHWGWGEGRGRWASESPVVGVDVQRALARLRREALPSLYPDAVEVERTIQRATGRVPSVVRSPAFYRVPFLARDILRYRAAAIAAGHADDRGLRWPRRRRRPSPAPRVRPLDALGNWRGMFSPTGIATRRLNRTLMNLPDEVPSVLVPSLRCIQLERAVLTPLALHTLLARAHVVYPLLHRPDDEQLRLLQHATDEEIREAAVLVAREHGDQGPTCASPVDVDRFVRYLGDYRGPSGRTLRSLVRRAIDWHHGCGSAAGGPEECGSLDRSTPTVPPPFPVPPLEGIRFLDTVGAVLDEGRRMGHCIASYAPRAVQGSCHLFHVTHAGTEASVSVRGDGSVEQARGPHNTTNEASRWAKAVFEGMDRGRPGREAGGALAVRWSSDPRRVSSSRSASPSPVPRT